MSIATVASQQSTTAASASGTTSTTSSALSSLSGNFDSFLKLLMTQLQNQDPTSPLNTDEFTSELVQFSGVEQQINTNSSLTQLIQLTQAGEIMQSSNMVGKTVAVTSDHMPLQNGSGALQFTAPAAEPVTITIADDTGEMVSQTTVSAQKGQNNWTWDGTNSAGNQVADGSYRVSVTSAASGATATAVPFTVLGTATGMQKQDSGIQLQLGALSVDFSAVQSIVTN